MLANGKASVRLTVTSIHGRRGLSYSSYYHEQLGSIIDFGK